MIMKNILKLLFTLFITINSFGQTPPIANFSMNGSNSNATGEAPFTVNLTDTSIDNGAAVFSRLWDFGDGNTSIAQNTSHSYNGVGRYTISLEVANAFGNDSIHKFITVLPNSPTGNSQQIYPGNTKTLADLTVSGTNIKWYDATALGTLLPSSTLLIDNTIYYASQTVNDIESVNRLEVTVHKISESSQTFLGGDYPTVNDLQSTPSTGATVSWYSSATSTTALEITKPLTTQTYFVEQEFSGTPIVKTNRLGVTVIVNGAPMFPTGNPTQIFTGDDKTLADLSVVGDNIKWYEASFGGTLLSPTTILTDNTIYYASQTVAGVESNFRLAVTAKRISSTKKAFVLGKTVADLTINPSANNTVKWYTTPAGGTPLTGTEIAVQGTYYIEQVAPTTITTLAGGFLDYLKDIAIKKDGQILVTSRDKIYIMNPDGTNQQLFRSFNDIQALAAEADGKILAANGDKIYRMDADGTNAVLLASLSDHRWINDIDVEVNGKILIGSYSKGLQRLDADGTNLTHVVPLHKLREVNDVASLPNGDVLYADMYNNQVRTVSSLGEVTAHVGLFRNLIGVAVGPNGKYYMTDDGSGPQYDYENLVRSYDIGAPRNEGVDTITNQIITVKRIAVDANGALLVTEHKAYNSTLKKIVESYTSNRVAVEVAIIDRPIALRNQIFTGDDKTLADLTVTGTAIKWYATATDGVVLPTSTLLTDNTIYYASQTIDGAESLTRVAVTAKRISDATQIKPNGTVADLVTTPTTGYSTNWFASVSGETALNNTTALTSNTYYVEQNIGTTATSLGSGFGGVRGIEVQTDGKILVVDGNNRDIKRMNADGSSLETLVSTGLSNPFGIAVLLDGKIIVADLSGDEIVRFDTDGSNKTVLGSGFDGPSDVAVQEDGKIVVADRSNNAIKRMNADGSGLEILGSGFSSPFGVAIQADGKILVAESNGTSIKRMDADGSNIVSLGSGFSLPRYLVQEPDGNILIADTGNNVVKRMSADGTTITTVTNTGHTARTFGIALEADGNFLVSNALTSATNIKRIIEEETSNRVAVEISFTNTWLGITDNTWHTASNWSGGIPTINLNTVIPSGTPNDPVINFGLNTVDNLTIDAGATLQIGTSGTLTIKGNVTQNGTITILSDATDNGSLILEGNQTGIGNVVYQRYVSTSVNPTDAQGWHFVSSPVSGQNINVFKNDVLRSGVKYAIARYDNSLATNRYNYYTDNTGANDIDVAGFFTKGIGYSIKRSTAGTVNFTGTLHTENVPIIITDHSGGVGNKWNLVGNPFTSSIALNNDANATNNFLLANATKLDPDRVAVYQWNASSASYDIYNQATGIAKYIAPGQGFFVNAIDGGATINFTEVMQEHQTGNIFSKTINKIPEINLFISEGKNKKNTQIKYFEATTIGLDLGYDAGTFSANANSFDIFTHLVSDSKGVNFGLQCLPNQDLETIIIPVGIHADANKNITISAKTLNLPTGVEVYLEDKDNNTFTNLNDEDYSFTPSTILKGIGRFYIHASSKALSVDDEFTSENLSIYKTSETNLRIVGVHDGVSKIILSDVLGKQVLNTKFEAKGVNDIPLPNLITGVYLVHLKTNQGTKTKKIIIE